MSVRKLLAALILTGLSGAIQVQAVFDNTTNSYSGGNLAGQHGWTLLQNYGTNGLPYPPGQSNQLGQVPFNVDNLDWVTTAGTDADFLTTTNGSFVYLDKITGNADDQVWTTTIDFNISLPDNGGAAYTMPNAEFFYVGLTAATTNGLSEFHESDACFILRTRAENGRLDVNFQDGDASAMRIIQSRPEDIGWAPEAVEDDGTSVTADYQTDDLRLILSLRKSREDNTYIAWATLTNLNTTYSTTGTDIAGPTTNKVVVNTFLTDAYAASDLKIAMGRSSQAYNANFNGGLLDVDVDALSVEVSSVPPAIDAPQNVSASPYNQKVILSWDAVVEAGSYNILRSESMGGPYSPVDTTTEISYEDTTVINETTYYYVIQSDFGAEGTGDSAEVSAKPSAIVTGTLVDTDFFDYTNDDLAGQGDWEQVSGSAANAFNVINAGTVDAAIDTVSTTASFSTNTGNAVYLDKLTDNALYDAWEGYIDFVLSAPQTAGTNISVFSNQDVLVFGITANREASLHLEDDDLMALMSLKVRANGKLVPMFADELNDSDNTRLDTLLYGTETGWDPQALSGPYDNVSDLMRLSWKIRKSSVDGTYQAFGSLSNLTGAAKSNTQVTVPFVTEIKQGVYDNPSATFVLGHYYKAKFSPAHELVNVTIQEMNVIHSSDNQPTVIAPEIGTLGGDRSVEVSWNETFEASDYDVLFAESAGGSQIVLTNVTGLSYLDTPRFNGVTNWYTVRANFPTGSADSTEAAGVPFASVKYVNLDGVEGNIVSANYALDQVTGLTTNTGGTIMYLNHMTNAIMTSSVNSKWINVPVYDLVQNDSVSFNISARTGTTGYEVKHNTGNATQLTADSVDLRPQGSSMKQLAFVKAEDWVDFEESSIDMTQDKHTITLANKLLSGSSDHRVAIRNGGLWYVNEQENGSGLLADLEAGRITVTNVFDEAWAPIGDNGFVDPDVLLTDPAQANFTTALNWTFTNVNAVGWFFSGSAGGRLKNYELTYSASGSIPSLDYWAADNNVTNLYEDIDGDNLINIDEYAFGGDPNDGNDVGILKQFTIGNHLGTDGFFYVHAESRDPDPGVSYAVETTDDLLQSFAAGEAVYVGEAPIDYFFKAVTNFIPADTESKFVGVEVTGQ